MKEKKHYIVKKVEDMNFHGEYNGNFNYVKHGHPEITIFVAPSGSKIYDDGNETDNKSTYGHIFIGIKGWNPVTKEKEALTIGFSPGDDMTTSKDNFSFDDHLRYPDASTLSIRSHNWPFLENFDKLFTLLHTYKTGEKPPPEYNIFFNNCGDFVQYVLEQSGFRNINISFEPDDLYKNLKHAADNYQTPLAIDLNGNGIQTLPSNLEIAFDFYGNNAPIQTGWIHSDDGLLVWDKNNDGVINNGNELFGDNSLLLDNSKAEDGFSALSILDSNTNGLIDTYDAPWSELKIWQDKNSDGISQKNELFTLNDMGINSIELNTSQINYYDKNGNFHKLGSSVNWSNGNKTQITDVLFHQKNKIADISEYNNKVNNIIHDMASFTSDNLYDHLPQISSAITSLNNPVITPNLLG